MKKLRKLSALTLIIAILSSSTVHATTCTDAEGNKHKASTTYLDTNFWDAYVNSWGSSDTKKYLFTVYNYNTANAFDDVQLLLFCPGKDTIKSVRGANVKYNHYAKFNIPWPDDDCKIQLEVRWENATSKSYSRISDAFHPHENVGYMVWKTYGNFRQRKLTSCK